MLIWTGGKRWWCFDWPVLGVLCGEAMVKWKKESWRWERKCRTCRTVTNAPAGCFGSHCSSHNPTHTSGYSPWTILPIHLQFWCDLVEPCVIPPVSSDSSAMDLPKIKYWSHNNCWKGDENTNKPECDASLIRAMIARFTTTLTSLSDYSHQQLCKMHSSVIS